MDDADRAYEIESALIERGYMSIKKELNTINPNIECEDCEKPIPEARRKVAPEATRCVLCQDLYERPRRVKRL